MKSVKSATLAFVNANIYTMNPWKPKAQAIAIHGERILKVGSNREVQRYLNRETETFDLRGKTVVPGLIDTHIHLTSFAKSLTHPDLKRVNSIKQLQSVLKQTASEKPLPEWIIARGWDQEKLREKRLPTREDIDGATDHPTILVRTCGHMCLANSKALEAANITSTTLDPKGGKIDKHPQTNEPTGILRENAMELIWEHVPKLDTEQITRACLAALRKAAANGVTTIHWITETLEEIEIVRRLHREAKLPVRIYLITSFRLLDELRRQDVKFGEGDCTLKVGGVKVFSDGSLGAHTAALKDPYSDKPETRGMLQFSQEEIYSIVSETHEAGFQLVIHAIGDFAVEAVLNALEKATAAPKKELRHRVEHLSVLSPELIRRVGELGVVASVQPHFVVSDFWVEDRLGPERCRWVYPFKSLLKENVVVTGGSDCPVEPVNPFKGIYGAVCDRHYSDENISVEEALRIYTVNAAYASFEEDVKGALIEGMLADLVVLTEDLFEIRIDKIPDVKAYLTIVGGQIVYKREPNDQH